MQSELCEKEFKTQHFLGLPGTASTPSRYPPAKSSLEAQLSAPCILKLDHSRFLVAEKDKQCAGGTLSLLLRYLRSDFAIPIPTPTSLDRNSRQADYWHWQPLNDIAAEQPPDVQFGVLQLLKMHL
jgi:hypothetical protein